MSQNFLILPTKLFCWGDYAEYYDYLADGTKVRHAYQDGQERIYAGSLVYDQGVFESAPFGGGRIVGTYDDSEAHYFLTDHIGSTRVVAKVTTAGRDDLDRKDYYPFGKAWTQAGMPMSENRYTFSGKEQVDVRYTFSGKEQVDVAIEDGITTPIHDFGARYYDSDGVLFFQQDPLMEKYYSIGQYNYCAGNPINRIDYNGNLIIFINGLTFHKKEQGTAAYWQGAFNGINIDFAASVQNQLNDNNVIYRHGATGMKAESRMLQGELQAVKDYDIILKAILDINGVPKETIKIITHSMGAAFGKGYVKKLKELFANYGHSDVLISLVADFDPYQAAQLSADPNIYTLQFTHKGTIADQRQKNLPDDNYKEDPRQNKHSIYSFFNDISQLEEGVYIYDGNNWILQK